MEDTTPQAPNDAPTPTPSMGAGDGPMVVQPSQTVAPAPAPVETVSQPVSADVMASTPSPAPVPANPNPEPLPASQPMGASFNTGGGKKKLPKLFVPVLVGAILLLGGGAFAYLGVYKQQPDVVWKDSMRNTARGIKEFSALDSSLQSGSTFSGSLDVEKPAVVTASVQGKMKDKNSETSGTVSAVGAKVDFTLLTLAAGESEYPDIYAKVKGLQSISAFAGPEAASQLAAYEDKWFFVDHTLLAQAAQSATQDTEAGQTDVQFTEQDIRDIRTKYADVLGQYVFTDDESKAIMQRTGEASTEDFDGKPTVKYAVNPNKENLKAFATALKDATKETKLKELVAPGDKSLEEALNFDDLLKSIDELDTSKAKIEVWADKGKRFIRNVRITPTGEDSGNATIDIGLNYNGGADYPFYIRINGDDEEAKGAVIVDLVINTGTKKVTMALNGDIDYKNGTDQDVKFKANFDSTPSSDEVNPEKPAGATNVMDLLGGFQSSQLTQDESPFDDPSFPALTDDMEL